MLSTDRILPVDTPGKTPARPGEAVGIPGPITLADTSAQGKRKRQSTPTSPTTSYTAVPPAKCARPGSGSPSDTECVQCRPGCDCIAYAVLDTETTGLARADQVIEAGYIVCYTDGSESCHSALWKTRRTIHPASFKVHGITRVMLATDGIPARDGLSTLQSLFDRLLAHDAYLVIHNSKFDVRMLNQTAHEHGVTLRWPTVRCSMAMARRLRIPVSNSALFDHFNGVVDGVAHRALVDCRMTLHSYTQMQPLTTSRVSTPTSATTLCCV